MKIKGKIIKIGTLQESKNGNHYVTVQVQIGWHEYKRYNEETQQVEDLKSADVVTFTKFHDDARNINQLFAVGEYIEFEMWHRVDERWGRCEVNVANIQKLGANAQPNTAQPNMAAPQAPAQPNTAAPVVQPTTAANAQPSTAAPENPDNLPF